MKKIRNNWRLWPNSWSMFLLLASFSILLVSFGCADDSGGGAEVGSEYQLSLGNWSGKDLSFFVVKGSYYLNDLSIAYRGSADGTICNYDYEQTLTVGTSIPVSNNIFSYNASGVTVTGEFINATEVEVNLTWSSYNSQCDATESGNIVLYANTNPGGNEDDDKDNFTENQGDCDDSNSDINPDESEICDDSIDNDCDEAIDDEDSDCVLTSCCTCVCESCTSYSNASPPVFGCYEFCVSKCDQLTCGSIVSSAPCSD